jgi:hypothetical protein
LHICVSELACCTAPGTVDVNGYAPDVMFAAAHEIMRLSRKKISLLSLSSNLKYTIFVEFENSIT